MHMPTMLQANKFEDKLTVAFHMRNHYRRIQSAQSVVGRSRKYKCNQTTSYHNADYVCQSNCLRRDQSFCNFTCNTCQNATKYCQETCPQKKCCQSSTASCKGSHRSRSESKLEPSLISPRTSSEPPPRPQTRRHPSDMPTPATPKFSKKTSKARARVSSDTPSEQSSKRDIKASMKRRATGYPGKHFGKKIVEDDEEDEDDYAPPPPPARNVNEDEDDDELEEDNFSIRMFVSGAHRGSSPRTPTTPVSPVTPPSPGAFGSPVTPSTPYGHRADADDDDDDDNDSRRSYGGPSALTNLRNQLAEEYRSGAEGFSSGQASGYASSDTSSGRKRSGGPEYYSRRMRGDGDGDGYTLALCRRFADQQYLQFALRITEDIIRSGCYKSSDMKDIIMQHFNMNTGKLDKTKMKQQITKLCKALNVNLDGIELDSGEEPCHRYPPRIASIELNSLTERRISSRSALVLINEIMAGKLIIRDSNGNEIDKAEVRDVINSLKNRKAASTVTPQTVMGRAMRGKKLTDEEIRHLSENELEDVLTALITDGDSPDNNIRGVCPADGSCKTTLKGCPTTSKACLSQPVESNRTPSNASTSPLKPLSALTPAQASAMCCAKPTCPRVGLLSGIKVRNPQDHLIEMDLDVMGKMPSIRVATKRKGNRARDGLKTAVPKKSAKGGKGRKKWKKAPGSGGRTPPPPNSTPQTASVGHCCPDFDCEKIDFDWETVEDQGLGVGVKYLKSGDAVISVSPKPGPRVDQVSEDSCPLVRPVSDENLLEETGVVCQCSSTSLIDMESLEPQEPEERIDPLRFLSSEETQTSMSPVISTLESEKSALSLARKYIKEHQERDRRDEEAFYKRQKELLKGTLKEQEEINQAWEAEEHTGEVEDDVDVQSKSEEQHDDGSEAVEEQPASSTNVSPPLSEIHEDRSVFAPQPDVRSSLERSFESLVKLTDSDDELLERIKAEEQKKAIDAEHRKISAFNIETQKSRDYEEAKLRAKEQLGQLEDEDKKKSYLQSDEDKMLQKMRESTDVKLSPSMEKQIKDAESNLQHIEEDPEDPQPKEAQTRSRDSSKEIPTPQLELDSNIPKHHPMDDPDVVCCWAKKNKRNKKRQAPLKKKHSMRRKSKKPD